MFKRLNGPFTVIVLCLSLILTGCAEQPQRLEPPPPKVTVMKPTLQKLADYDEFNGQLETKPVEVRARVRGYIKKVHFQDGQIVKKGDLLFELDPRPFEAQVKAAQAKLNIYKAQKVAAEKEEVRLRELKKIGGASESQIEKAEADTKSFIAQADATNEEIRSRQLDLEFSRITAAIGGKVSEAMLTEGNLVNAGGSDPLLTTIVPLNPIYVTFNVDERTAQRYIRKTKKDKGQTGSIREGKYPFEFGLDTDSGFPHKGTLDFADNQVDPNTGTIKVRGIVNNDKGTFLPGFRARVRLPITEEYEALLVPDTAILSDQDKRYVLLVDARNVVHRRDVTLGVLRDDGMRIILPGSDKSKSLTANDRIIVQGLLSARINYPVEPVSPAAPQP